MIKFECITEDGSVEVCSFQDDLNIHQMAELFERFLLAMTYQKKTIKVVLNYDEDEL